jgi:hypothetical protein
MTAVFGDHESTPQAKISLTLTEWAQIKIITVLSLWFLTYAVYTVRFISGRFGGIEIRKAPPAI